VKVREVAIDAIKPYPGNPRRAKAAVSKVKASLAEFGFQQPIVVDKAMVIIVGHTRYQAARELGLTKVPVVVADALTDAQAKAYRIADNRTGAEAEFDLEKLAVELRDLQDLEYNIGTLGFDAAELDDLIGEKDDGVPAEDPGLGNPVISYQLIFETEAEQAVWFDFLRWLKAEMPQQETISARLTRFLSEREYVSRP